MSRITTSQLWQRVFRTRADDVLPHTVSHQRIYIVPSARGCAFLITLLIMLIASINYSLSLGYALCFLLTGLFAATLLHTYRNISGISITNIEGEDTYAGEPVHFRIRLHNRQSRIRHGIRIRTLHDDSELIRLPPSSDCDAALILSPKARGRCSLGRLTLQSDWPLGLWSCWSYLHVHRQVFVFPSPEVEPPPLPSLEGDDLSLQAQTAMTGDVSGLRDYQPGDSIGSIAWKSAARGQGLKSRTFDNPQTKASTVLDFSHTRINGLEARLSRLCAWVLKAEASKVEYSITLPDHAQEKGAGREHSTQALIALALFGNRDNEAA